MESDFPLFGYEGVGPDIAARRIDYMDHPHLEIEYKDVDHSFNLKLPRYTARAFAAWLKEEFG